ncbi:IS66 family insertion sequence element accessory protein TnpB [Pseudorhodobacter sp. W20_MBD10_FR17]|uniref:IS66 family insertion sequence element accessory protein TnpB n=1 Tax=Pseudorhodobacter sp. W20_MBD10_FR17 TaxID=3240266 RepID=UPI003F9E55A6
MIAFPAGTKVWIVGGVTDMRRGMNTLAVAVQQDLGRDPQAAETELALSPISRRRRRR